MKTVKVSITAKPAAGHLRKQRGRTQAPKGDIVGLYKTLPWAALCAEVAKLKIDVHAGQLLELRNAELAYIPATR